MNKFICILSFLLITTGSYAKDFFLYSPDRKIRATISVGATLQYSLAYQGTVCLLPSAIGLTLTDGRKLGENPALKRTELSSVNTDLKPLYGISASLEECYNQLELSFAGHYKLVLRAYNQGFAYRFVTALSGEINVQSEKSEFKFSGHPVAYMHPELSESNYVVKPFGTGYSSLPLLVKADDGLNMMIHESDVFDYPCMALYGKQAVHAKVPRKVGPGGHMNFNLKVLETENYISRTSGSRSFPWRLIAFEKTDSGLLQNQLVYLLNRPSVIGDASWLQPGKVAWDWWNALNLSGVDFKTGFNTETYKYFIDFAAKNGIRYVNLDEGWSDQFNLMKITGKLDMPELIRYAKAKNTGLILWCVWYTLDRQMIQALDQFEKWGISGVKVDFMDRDDQLVVNFQERLLKEAAKRKMMVNYHGAYHPNGMERAYPNYINTEGVKGLEWNKFDQAGVGPDHDVTIPFIRMFAGAMDYTPGAMQNYNKADWRQVFDRPMSQGTRCHQLAMYTIYYAPLQMLADAPTAYEKEPVYLKYLSGIPTVWDETLPLDSKIGQYVCLARRKGKDWFLGAMTGWTAKKLKLTLDFLEEGEIYEAEIFRDGPNAERVGSDYQRIVQEVGKGAQIEIDLAAGGGWSARFNLK